MALRTPKNTQPLTSSFTNDGPILTSTAPPATPPTVTTAAATSITTTTVVGNGNVTNGGSATVTARGVCWSTSINPTISDSHTVETGTTGIFASNVSGLTQGTFYYMRAYATNSGGQGYGDNVTFTTNGVYPPTVTTNTITSISYTSAVGGGNVTVSGTTSVTVYGICWSTSLNPTTSDSMTTDGSGVHSFVSNLTSLLQGTLYHVRAYAINSIGTSYGSDVTFTTPMDLATRISIDISTQDSLLASVVSVDITNQSNVLFSAISSNLTIQDNSLAAQISTQFANRSIV